MDNRGPTVLEYREVDYMTILCIVLRYVAIFCDILHTRCYTEMYAILHDIAGRNIARWQ